MLISATASEPELSGYREARHEGLEGMLVDICPPVRVAADLGMQPIDIPELGRGRVGIEQIVDAQSGAPARRETHEISRLRAG